MSSGGPALCVLTGLFAGTGRANRAIVGGAATSQPASAGLDRERRVKLGAFHSRRKRVMHFGTSSLELRYAFFTERVD